MQRRDLLIGAVSGLLAGGAAGGLAGRKLAGASADAPTVARPSSASSEEAEGFPHRIVLTWTEDPERTITVTWRSLKKMERPRLKVVADSADPEFADDEQRVDAQLVEASKTNQGKEVFHYTATMRGLSPDTVYLYRVGDPAPEGLDGKDANRAERWSAWMPFRTAPSAGAPWRFLYFGDAQNNIRSRWSRVVRAALRACPDARLVVHAGDLIDNADADGQWGEWFEAAGWLHESIPLMAVAGNHEYWTPDGAWGEQLAPAWQPQFTFPANGPKLDGELAGALDDTTYWFDVGGVRFIALNTNLAFAEQAPWLEAALAAPGFAGGPRPHWTIAVWHHPMVASAVNRDTPEVRQHWRDILEGAGVDLVLQGHDHTYARTPKLAGGKIVADDAPGIVYATSIAGTKMYELNPDTRDLFKRVGEGIQLYQVVSVEAERITYEGFLSTGEVYDAFELAKKPGEQTARLVDRIPPSAEKLVT